MVEKSLDILCLLILGLAIFFFAGGITLRSGRRGFAIYREGKVIEQYTFVGLNLI